MFEEIIAFVRDAIVIGYMFVLRIGVPIIVTLFMGWWLERKLAEWDAKEIAELEAAKDKERRQVEQPIHSQVK